MLAITSCCVAKTDTKEVESVIATVVDKSKRIEFEVLQIGQPDKLFIGVRVSRHGTKHRSRYTFKRVDVRARPKDGPHFLHHFPGPIRFSGVPGVRVHFDTLSLAKAADAKRTQIQTN